MSKIGGGAKDEETLTERTRDESDKASADFGHNPKGWREFCLQGFVARLANIRDIHCAALRALKQNRASVAYVLLC